MNPEKLAEFTNAKLLPAEAKKYLHQIVDKEVGGMTHLQMAVAAAAAAAVA